MKEMEKLKAIVDRLHALLDAPEPGLWTWHEMLHRQIREFHKLTGVDIDAAQDK